MKALITISVFAEFTGAEMYVYELARELKRTGHEPTIAVPRKNMGPAMGERAAAAGLKTIPLQDLRPEMEFDILHLNEKAPSEWALGIFPKTPAVATIHSEFACEEPLLSPRIFRYIAIRPGIKAKLEAANGIDPSRIEVIPNGFDLARFNRHYDILREGPQDPDARPVVLFVGTIDRRRLEAIRKAAEYCQRTDREFWLVGLLARVRPEELPRNAKVYPATWDVEQYFNRCDETAGIMLGRTTIEGWLCGKPGWIYDVDEAGHVTNTTWTEPPQDLDRFNIRTVAGQIASLYGQAREAAR